MQLSEFLPIVKMLKSVYPNQNFLADENAIKVWHLILQDLDVKAVESAVVYHVSTSSYPPTPADIRKACAPALKDWGTAWSDVQRVIQKYGSWDKEKALDELDDTTRTIVNRIGYDNLCMSTNISIERANFRQMYEIESTRTQERAQLPRGYTVPMLGD